MKGNKGITLIALVITIIVLLILAGVSIAMLSGENSILNRANQAGKTTSTATARELVATAVNEAMSNYYYNVHVGNSSTSTIVGEINTKLDASTGVGAEIKKDSAVDYTYTAAVADTSDGTVTIKYKADGENFNSEATIDKTTGAVKWTKIDGAAQQ